MPMAEKELESPRTHAEIQIDLFKPIPGKYLDTKRKQGTNLAYIT
jgi:hypothetical protein